MDASQNPYLVGSMLDTLLKFLNWIPLGYIFETKLISTLIYKFLNVPMFRNVTLTCLTEIACVQVNQYESELFQLFWARLCGVSVAACSGACCRLLAAPLANLPPSSRKFAAPPGLYLSGPP